LRQVVSGKNIIISYNIYGKGNFPLLCFHGYGQTSEIYSIYETTLGKDYRLYSIDLFYHGGSTIIDFREDVMKEIVNMMEYIMKKNGIEEFGVFGYSIGCRSAMMLIDNFYDRVKYVVLSAPDFFYERMFFKFSTRSILGKSLFKFVVKNNRMFLYVLYLLRKLGLIEKSLYKISALNLRYKHRIRKVYNVWNLYSKYQYGVNVLNKLSKDVIIEIYLAKGDSIVKNNKIEKLLKYLNCDYKMIVVPTNHFDLLYGINKLLLDKK